MLSPVAKSALVDAYAAHGKQSGQLLKRCPRSNTLAAAAWRGAMMVCNPFQVSVGAILFMSAEQREVFEEVKNHFEALPRDYHTFYRERTNGRWEYWSYSEGQPRWPCLPPIPCRIYISDTWATREIQRRAAKLITVR
jgi:hypothetical protein